MIGNTIRQHNNKFFQNWKCTNLHIKKALQIVEDQYWISAVPYCEHIPTFVLIDFSRNCLVIDLTILGTSCFNNHLGLYKMLRDQFLFFTGSGGVIKRVLLKKRNEYKVPEEHTLLYNNKLSREITLNKQTNL